MERIYGRRKHIGGTREFDECNEIDRRIQEGKIRRGNVRNKDAKSRKNKAKFRGKGV